MMSLKVSGQQNRAPGGGYDRPDPHANVGVDPRDRHPIQEGRALKSRGLEGVRWRLEGPWPEKWELLVVAYLAADLIIGSA